MCGSPVHDSLVFVRAAWLWCPPQTEDTAACPPARPGAMMAAGPGRALQGDFASLCLLQHFIAPLAPLEKLLKLMDKLVQGLEHMPCEEKLKQLWVFTL